MVVIWVSEGIFPANAAFWAWALQYLVVEERPALQYLIVEERQLQLVSICR